MAYIRVTLEAIFKVPDDARLEDHPSEELLCVRIGDSYYMPTTSWIKEDPPGLWSDESEELLELFQLETETIEIEDEPEAPGENGGTAD